ncbi:hypothetical protein BDV59DRAFT_71189 [Aspergillus ambiguus]|uniref:uncharacterized protein n=1 Tax=Aspergillus ambiguus TaxID=176160 RepID=UPI003CCD9CDE
MPPAASDDPSRQQSRYLGDNLPLPDDLSKTTTENDLGGKSKKKNKSGSKAKAKAAKAAAKASPEDLIDTSSPPQVEPSSCPDPPLESEPTTNIVSPVLDALGALEETPENDLTYRTDNWAKSIPFGKSPPKDIGDGDLPSGSPFGYLATPDRGGFSHPSSASPPPRMRPLSYGNGYPSGSMSRQQSIDRQKSHSLSSHFNHHIPPPHMPQAHFYGAPDIDLPVSHQNRSPADGSYSFCAFDTLSSPSFKSSRMGGTVLLVGTDGGLEIFAIEERKSRLIGKLTGLNGRVIDAKILPGGLPGDPFSSSRPHVAIILHGPSSACDDEGQASSAGSEANEIPTIPSGQPSSAEKRSVRDDMRFYQTRVEVYSLRSGEHITTLFAARSSPCLDNIPGLPMFAPAPTGNLKLFTSSSYVVLGSGVSGEVYIYSLKGYHCLGKTWTNIHTREARRYSTSSSSTDPDGSRNDDSPHGMVNGDGPILALKGRWLAIVPPSSGYRTSLRGSVPQSLIFGKVFGVETRSPPARPAVNCATDVGDGESLFDKVARGVTQELVRGARWMGDQGLQAWNNYWNKDQPQNSAPRRNVTDFPPSGYHMFPPTHAQDTPTSTPAEPDLVSIIDLNRLEEGGEMKNALFNPVATFQVPNGCSFLSFSPNGLMLLTASKKGDVQYVWDLLQAKYCRAGTFLSDGPTPPCANVRQVARYARLTTSHVVDVIWCPPSGDRLAIITRKGTVHVFDLPRTAFQWPPFRRARPGSNKSPTRELPSDEFADKPAGANPFSAAFKLVGDKTQPILAAVRGRTPSTGAAFPPVSGFAIPSAASVRSGKVVAAGLSKSMGAATGTVNTLRHVGENRLHLSGLARDPAAARVTWVTHKGQAFLGLVDSGVFRLYRIRRSPATHKSRQFASIIGGKETEFRLPPQLQTPSGAIVVGALPAESTVSATLALPSANIRAAPGGSQVNSQPLSKAEIETNAPYQPFHTDQRVKLFIYSEPSDGLAAGEVPPGPWVFGDGLATSQLHVRPFSAGGEDDDEEVVHEPHGGYGGEMENLISLASHSSHGEEVVITTRRKKKRSASYAAGGIGADDGFFEDDCEVLDFARDRV